MIKSQKLKQIAKIAVPILKRNGVVRAGIFGSAVRGEMKKSSDVDFLIKLRGRKSLLDFVGIKIELEEHLKRKVDLVEYETIKPRLKNAILDEEVKII